MILSADKCLYKLLNVERQYQNKFLIQCEFVSSTYIMMTHEVHARETSLRMTPHCSHFHFRKNIYENQNFFYNFKYVKLIRSLNQTVTRLQRNFCVTVPLTFQCYRCCIVTATLSFAHHIFRYHSRTVKLLLSLTLTVTTYGKDLR